MRVAIGQFGAPTTVLNSSLYGVMRALETESTELYGVVGGVQGLVKGHLLPLQDARSLRWMRETPGAALRAGRYTSSEDVIEKAVDTLSELNIDAFVLMGGNGTMSLGLAIHEAAEARGSKLSVVGIPKTIDNDIVGIDHSPGFPSAARFVVTAVRDLQLDLEAMVGFEQVRIVEVMGRRCGWLAAVSSVIPHLQFAKRAHVTNAQAMEQVQAPIICLPETPLVTSSLMQSIEYRVQTSGNAMVVVSEGVRDKLGNRVLQAGKETDDSSRTMFGGIGESLADSVRQQFGYGVRYENLGLLQRCWNDCSLASDRANAEQLGVLAGKSILQGCSGVMVGFDRPNPNKFELVETYLPLEEVAGRDRLMEKDDLSFGENFLNWLRPLVELDTIEQHPRLGILNEILHEG